MFVLGPGAASALTLYSYVPGVGYESQGEYQATKIEKVAERAFRSVVIIEGYRESPVYSMELGEDPETGAFSVSVKEIGVEERKVTSGSGFFATGDGYIVTNRHVVDGFGASFWVDTGASRVPAFVAFLDPVYDLALIKIEGEGYPAIPFGDSSKIEMGDEIVSVGNALGRFVDSVSSGRVISLDQTVVAREKGTVEVLSGLIATDARLYPGDSGGPLLNARGEAIGVNVAIEAGTNVSFSIPSNVARVVMERAGIEV